MSTLSDYQEAIQSMDKYLDIFALSERAFPKDIKLVSNLYKAALKVNGVASYRGVQIVEVKKRKRYRKNLVRELFL